MPSLKNFLRIHPGEGRRTATLALQYFFITAVVIAGKSARDTYFLSRFDKSYLPLMFVASAGALTLVSALYGKLTRHNSNKRMLTMTSALFAAVLTLLQLRLEGWVVAFLYVWMEITTSVLIVQFWLQAADLYDPRQAKRLYGLIGGGGSVAAVLIGTGLKPYIKAFGAGAMLWVVIGAILLAWLLGDIAQRYAQPRAQRRAPPRQRAKRRMDPYLVSIASLVVLAALVTQLVDYQFKVIASNSIPNEGELAAFFGHFYALTGFLTLVMQFFVTAPLLSHFGLLTGMLVLPSFLALGSGAILLWPKLASAFFAKASDQVFKFTLNNSASELLWMPIPPERRQAMRPFISGTVKAMAEGSAGLLAFAAARFAPVQALSGFVLVALTAWFVVIFRTRGLYVRALAAAIEKRQVDFEELEVDVQEPAVAAVLEEALRSREEPRALFAIELLSGLSLGPWKKMIRDVFPDSPPAVRSRILMLAAQERDLLTAESILEATGGGRVVGPVAVHVATGLRLPGLEARMESLLHDAEPGTRAAAATTLLQLNGIASEPAASIVRGMLDSEDDGNRIAALEESIRLGPLLTHADMEACLTDPSRGVREAALTALATRADVAFLPRVVSFLTEPGLGVLATRTLRSFPADAVVEQLTTLAGDAAKPRRARTAAVRALSGYPAPASIQTLLDLAGGEDYSLGVAAATSLLQMARKDGLPPETIEGLEAMIVRLTEGAYRLNRLLLMTPAGPETQLLRDDLETSYRRLIAALITIAALKAPESPVESTVQVVLAGDSGRLAFALEYLDLLVGREKKSQVSPLIEATSLQERDDIGQRYFRDLPAALEPYLEHRLYKGTDWHAATALHYLLRAGRWDLVGRVDWARLPVSALVQELRTPEGGAPPMYSTLEKTILLKAVNLFQGIPADNLAHLAQVAEVVRYPAGDTVFKEGDFGDALFIVVEGSVGIEKGGRQIAVLHKGDALGEMALLDGEPRSASVVAAEDSTLMRIGQESFYEAMTTSPEFMQGVVRLLVRRLRDVSAKLSERG